jgi:predicted RNase H-like HicB family nuclease
MKQIHTIVWKEDELYVAKALEVEVASQGESEEEALSNLEEALELYFEDNTEVNYAPVRDPKLQDQSLYINA